MPFLKNQDYKTVMQAKKDGDPKAIALMQAYLKGCSQHDLDSMLHAFYNPDPVNNASEQEQDPINEPAVEAVEKTEAEIQAPEPEPEPETEPVPVAQIADISAQLDADLDGLIDDDEISDCTFEDFLNDKKKNANRLSKGPDYFKMYDPAGRLDYMTRKTKEFDDSFNTKRLDIDRAFRDMDGAISAYSQSVNMIPDDGVELDQSAADKAYGDLVTASGNTHSFGRSWDPTDMDEMNSILSALVQTYGKANVSAALNVIRGDNEAFRDRRNGQIDAAVKRHAKQLEDLLK